LAKAKRAQTSAAFRAYLARGGKQKDVSDVLLPRAELAEAEKEGTVDAIEKYQAAHSSSRIAGEVSASLRKAMLAELDKAARQGTVTALLDFKRRHPSRLVEPELGQAVHVVYRSAYDSYRAQAPNLPNVQSFMERLLNYCEQKGAGVQIRFQ